MIGGLGLIPANRKRVQDQSGVGANTVVKSILTGAAIATTAYSGVLGAKILAAGPVAATSGTVPAATTPEDIADTQNQLRVLQWVTPVLTGLLVILGAQQGEQQRPTQVAEGIARKVVRRVRRN